MSEIERYVVEIGMVKGKRAARRRKLLVPFDAAVGEYERLSDRQLNDLIKDLRHEQRRRTGELFDGQEAQRPLRWNPNVTYRGEA